MAYQEYTSIANAPALIDNVCAFAALNGWTVERNDLVGSNRTATLRIPGTTDYIHLFNTAVDRVRHRISVGYDGLLAPSAQTNVTPVDGQMDLRAGPSPKMWIFARNNVIHVAVAISESASYRFLSFGLIDKIGTYDGGTFCESGYFADGQESFIPANSHVHLGTSRSASDRGGFIRADCALDSRANFFHEFGNQAFGGEDPVTGQRGASTQWPHAPTPISAGLAARVVKCSDENTFSGRSVLQPVHVNIRRTGSPAYYSPAGTIPDIRFINIRKFDVEQEIVIGSDTWKIFPGVRKAIDPGTNGVSNRPASGPLGYAFLKTV